VSKFGDATNNFSHPFRLFRHGAHAIPAFPNAFIPNITIYLLRT
jgi:hypothetical protein